MKKIYFIHLGNQGWKCFDHLFFRQIKRTCKFGDFGEIVNDARETTYVVNNIGESFGEKISQAASMQWKKRM